MRHTLRRILWIVPTLLLVSLFSFAALSRSDAGALPRFFQPSPQSVRDLALGAMARVAEGDRQAHAELARLGGAALPFVLPALDGLAPAGRARVAVALAPVARRMGVGGGEALERPETAVLFWTRFWQDRGIDFRPAVVKRAVKRLGMRSTVGRRDDVLQLDTYALSELVGAMGDVRSEDDVSRVRRLAAAAAHVTGMALRVERDASIADAERAAAEWRRWWRKHKSEYSTLDGPSRIVAMFSQTQYGRWAVGAADERLGLTESGEPVLDLLEARAPVSLWLVFWALVAGYLGGIAVGLAGAVRAHRPLDLSTTAATLLVVAVPTATVATLLAPPTYDARELEERSRSWCSCPWRWSRATSAPHRERRWTRSTSARCAPRAPVTHGWRSECSARPALRCCRSPACNCRHCSPRPSCSSRRFASRASVRSPCKRQRFATSRG